MSEANGRTCHYCEQPKCKCVYRVGRKGEYSLHMQNHSRQTTIGEMREGMKNYITLDDATPAVWSISYTVIDPNKPAKTSRKAKLEVPSE